MTLNDLERPWIFFELVAFWRKYILLKFKFVFWRKNNFAYFIILRFGEKYNSPTFYICILEKMWFLSFKSNKKKTMLNNFVIHPFSFFTF